MDIERQHASVELLKNVVPAQKQQVIKQLAAFLGEDPGKSVARKVRVPPQVIVDCKNHQFVAGEFNKHPSQESYRSPWTNEYHPESDGPKLNESRRGLQQSANVLFQEYVMLYYDKAVSSFYVADQDYGFDCAFYVHKDINEPDFKGLWNSQHYATVKVDVESLKVSFKMVSTVLVEFEVGGLLWTGVEEVDAERCQPFNKKGGLDQLHLEVLGSMVEDNETAIRSSLQSVQAPKTREIITGLRTACPITKGTDRKGMQLDLRKLIKISLTSD